MSDQYDKYLKLLNTQKVQPVKFLFSDRQLMLDFEKENVVVMGNSVNTLIDQLLKLYERFTPEPLRSKKAYKEFLEQSGLDSKNLKQSLADQITVVYFPSGMDFNSRVVYSKLCYLPHNIHREMLLASEWDLVSEKVKRSLRASRHTAIGLSVGSWLVQAAVRSGVEDFDLVDPGTTHLDAIGRLGSYGFDMSRLGINKAILVSQRIFFDNPYAKIRIIPEGINQKNVSKIFDLSLMDGVSKGGIWYIAEEADDFEAKSLARKGLHKYFLKRNINSRLIMIADVGNKNIVLNEKKNDEPFLGIMKKVDPKQNLFGDNMTKRYGDSLPLFASIGGTTGIGDPLLEMLERGYIGNTSDSKITRVPQSITSTYLAAAIYANYIRICASGGSINSHCVVDIEKVMRTNNKPLDNKKVLIRQRNLNKLIFGNSNLLEM